MVKIRLGEFKAVKWYKYKHNGFKHLSNRPLHMIRVLVNYMYI